MVTFYVNPATGNDFSSGDSKSPFKTLKKALSQAQSGTTIYLEAGTYNSLSGEVFPLIVPSGVIIIGNESGKGSGILIEGNGLYTSPSAASQNITILMQNNAQLRGVTVTNIQTRGTGIWIESQSPMIANCTLTRCKREGVYAVGSGKPQILNSLFIQNEGYGISIEGEITGEIQGNTFQNTGYGLSIKDQAAPLIRDNAIVENRSGLLIANDAKPILRQNLIERNTGDGVVIMNQASPDLGTAQTPGGNTIRNNGGFDINNAGTVSLTCFGNIISPTRVKGTLQVVTQTVPMAASATLFVNSATGNDSASGGQSDPLKTIAKALSRAQSGTVIQVAPGNYNAASGEVFPLIVPSGVTILGNEATKGKDVVIVGSGTFTSPSAAAQNITILMQNNSTVKGVSVTNEQTRGTGIWAESVYCTVASCTLTKSKREGLFATGTSIPAVLNSDFIQNVGNGIALAGNAKGEIRGNKFQNTGYAIAVQASAAPLIIENEILENRSGIVLSGQSKPVLRKNQVKKNLQDGLTVIADSAPDMGNPQDNGGNVFVDNGKYDVQNASKFTLISVGNQINPTRTLGSIEFTANQSPTPGPSPTPTPGPSPTPTPVPGGAKFNDIGSHWARTFIERLADMGIISGFPDGSFKPDATLTRAQHAAMLMKAFELTPIREATGFSDVATDFWGKEAIEKANRAGFLSGYPDKTFRPNQNLTRSQGIVSLVNGLKLTGGTPANLSVYTDRVQIPSFATNAMITATELNMVVNYPKKEVFNPLKDVTRAEIAAIFYQTLVALNRAQAIDSPYIV